jgi:hypothetical protein
METEKGGLYSNSGQGSTIRMLPYCRSWPRASTTERIVEVRDEPNPSRGFSLRYLKGCLCLDQCGDEILEVSGVDVADRDDTQLGCGGGAEVEAGESARECGKDGAGRSLREEEGDLVLVDGEVPRRT